MCQARDRAQEWLVYVTCTVYSIAYAVRLRIGVGKYLPRMLDVDVLGAFDNLSVAKLVVLLTIASLFTTDRIDVRR